MKTLTQQFFDDAHTVQPELFRVTQHAHGASIEPRVPPLSPVAAARFTDPATSHEAAADVEATGVAHQQRGVCLQEVLNRPGQTAAEIAVAVGLERHAPSRRLPELRKAGLVYNGEHRECREQRRRAVTWYPETGDKR